MKERVPERSNQESVKENAPNPVVSPERAGFGQFLSDFMLSGSQSEEAENVRNWVNKLGQSLVSFIENLLSHGKHAPDAEAYSESERQEAPKDGKASRPKASAGRGLHERQETARTGDVLVDGARLARQENPGIFVKGKCEQAVRIAVSRIIELATGRPKGSVDFRIRNTRIDSAATSALRGKKISALTYQDLHALKPGEAIYMSGATDYAKHGVRIIPGTSNKLPIIPNSHRHWVMWDGRGFTDNWGVSRTLDDLKRLAGGSNRVVINIHDPLGQYGVSV